MEAERKIKKEKITNNIAVLKKILSTGNYQYWLITKINVVCIN